MMRKNVFWEEKRMFGGDCFMVDGKMCFVTFKGGLMVRLAPEEAERLVKKEGAAHLSQEGKSMKGFLLIQPEGFDSDADLEYWIQKCLDFNPFAKASRKKKKK